MVVSSKSCIVSITLALLSGLRNTNKRRASLSIEVGPIFFLRVGQKRPRLLGAKDNFNSRYFRFAILNAIRFDTDPNTDAFGIFFKHDC